MPLISLAVYKYHDIGEVVVHVNHEAKGICF